MTTGKLVSIKLVADRLMQNPMMSDVPWEFIISNVVECMRIVGTKPMYISSKETIEVAHFRGLLPLNVMQIDGVFRVDNNKMLKMDSNEDDLSDHYNSFSSTPTIIGGPKFSLGNSKIHTSFETGKVLIVYKSIATDEDCFPLLPDNPEFLRAARAYVRYQWYDILNDMDKISSAKLNKAEVDYLYYVGQAQSSLQMPDEAEMEALTNSITQMLPSTTQHKERFAYLGNQEFLKTH